MLLLNTGATRGYVMKISSVIRRLNSMLNSLLIYVCTCTRFNNRDKVKSCVVRINKHNIIDLIHTYIIYSYIYIYTHIYYIYMYTYLHALHMEPNIKR